MRVLAHIHTLNDSAVIEQALESLRRQTRPVDAIILVDNASTDNTLDRTFADNLKIVRNSINLGTSGAIWLGMAHALEHGYDWTWVFDADSVPEPDALENLLSFYDHLSPAEKSSVCFLASRMATASGRPRDRPMSFTKRGIEYVDFDQKAGYCKCDCFIWTGSLFRMEAVARIGLPSRDYVLDVAELEYGYRARELQFQSYVVRNAVVNQDVGRNPGVETRMWRRGPLSFRLVEIPPIRCYYHVRNMVYFWLYQCRPYRPQRILRSLIHAVAFPRTFIVRPTTHGHHVVACLRGFWDGLTMHMERRY